ncbi:type II toxin-antitoxin system RelE/ParE family toxin [Faecalicatena contorta]|uniref:type II toxin-antitoxin system RelE/ParE family toxin n=1 Tax=Faecalicatena contorta TaxID=39482 RepID=UPI001F45AAE5|nr:type II toxin-antitoxin system RelE/ParE family toxin [Faecalicatena contorta]MCF2554387.1 type II toxin-antitoxin system RelE/ParE family toxin [Faecalicatena contorta]
MKIYYTPEASQDLQIVKASVIEKLFDEVLALQVLKDITQNIRKLETFPNMGSDLSAVTSAGKGYRYLFCRKNYIFYRVEEDAVRIIRVLMNNKIMYGYCLE